MDDGYVLGRCTSATKKGFWISGVDLYVTPPEGQVVAQVFERSVTYTVKMLNQDE